MSRTPRSNPDVGYGRPMPWINLEGAPPIRALDSPRWQGKAACRSLNPQLWFADGNSPLTRRAAQVCATCPVRRVCLASALVYAEEFGLWGGVSAVARGVLLRRLSAGEPLGAVLDDALNGAPRFEVA
jgi:WhiB family redox-sensing transcriptional regulator